MFSPRCGGLGTTLPRSVKEKYVVILHLRFTMRKPTHI